MISDFDSDDEVTIWLTCEESQSHYTVLHISSVSHYTILYSTAGVS